jgi:DNA-binding IclR family transcriptional regulator
MKKRDQPSYFVPALEKGLDVLETLANASAPQTLAELARSLNRTSSELFRMIDALEKRSYIVRDPTTGAYSLTLKLYELAHTHSPVDQLLRAADLPMRQLVKALHETCLLSVIHDDILVVIAQQESREPVRLSVEIGSRVPPLNTTSGWLLVAFMPAERRRFFLAQDSIYAKMSRAKRVEFHKRLAAISDAGWHFALSTRRTGFDLSCLVGNPSLGVTAALAVPFLPGGPHEGKEKRTLPIVQECAARITTTLGLTPAFPALETKAALSAPPAASARKQAPSPAAG